jgi:hypothetical protein
VVLLYFLRKIGPALVRPVQSKLKQVYSSIHDDMYLIGKKLLDFDRSK